MNFLNSILKTFVGDKTKKDLSKKWKNILNLLIKLDHLFLMIYLICKIGILFFLANLISTLFFLIAVDLTKMVAFFMLTGE